MSVLIWIIGGCLIVTMGIFTAIGCHAMWMQHVWMWRLADTRWHGLELMARAQQLPDHLLPEVHSASVADRTNRWRGAGSPLPGTIAWDELRASSTPRRSEK